MTLPVPPSLHDDSPSVSKGRRRAQFLITGVMVAAAGAAGVWWLRGRAVVTEPVGSAVATQMDALAMAPAGVRIRVRVVNAADVNGLAKRATSVLRDHGFDVVDYEGVKQKSPRATTLVQTHTGHDDWSSRVARALGTGTVESRPDSSRYVDVTVFLGLDWKAPSQAFRP